MTTSRARGHAIRRPRHQRLRWASDDELLSDVRDGSDAAFAELYRRHHDDARSYAARLAPNRDRGVADDIVSEAIRKVLAAVRRGRGPTIGFRQYLFTAVRTVTSTTRASARHDANLELPHGADAPAADDGLDTLVAAAAFASLPERWRDILWMTKVDEMTPAEIAPRVGLGPNAVAALSVRAREALRVAYVRHHLPATDRRPCRQALDLLARRAVVPLSPARQWLLNGHLATCDHCLAAAASIESDLEAWARSIGRSAVLAGFRRTITRPPATPATASPGVNVA